jgi:hypothetical protein
LANVESAVEILDFGVWKNDGWVENGQLTKFNSVDWYMKRAREESNRRDQLNANMILNLFVVEPWQRVPHYDLAILSSDIYSRDNNFVIGLASPLLGAVVSINRFLNLNEPMRSRCIQTELYHELGHVFDIIPPVRKTNIQESLGVHCVNICSMRQGLVVPNDWVTITQDRLRTENVFCPECKKGLREYFI